MRFEICIPSMLLIVILFGSIPAAGDDLAPTADYPVGFVWNRFADWTPGAVHGGTVGNPDDDPMGIPVWGYEWNTVDLWWADPTAQMVWDSDWFGGGQGRWARGDDLNPPIAPSALTHTLGNSAGHVSLVRWINPAGDGKVVSVSGELVVTWTGNGGMGSPSDVDVAVVHVDQSAGGGSPVLSTTVSKPNPGDTVGDTVAVAVDLLLQVDSGDHLIITHRANPEEFQGGVGSFCGIGTSI